MSGPGDPVRAFWKGFTFAVRNQCVEEFLDIYRPLQSFAAQVAEAEQALDRQRRRIA